MARLYTFVNGQLENLTGGNSGSTNPTIPFRAITREEYNALQNKHDDVAYFVTDGNNTGQLILNTIEYGSSGGVDISVVTSLPSEPLYNTIYLLKETVKGKVKYTPYTLDGTELVPFGGSGGIEIDDSNVSEDTTFSSKKIDDDYVKKVEGKSLSTNDLTDEIKSSYDESVEKSHEHENKANVLDKLSTNEGKLLFDGKTIETDITVDNTLSDTSTNPVQNKVIKSALESYAPHLSETNTWVVNDVDTGVSAVGKDGRSVKTIATDSNNNVIVTFSDNTTKTVGKLNIDVSADFLTSGGFGKLRYYSGKMQYLNGSTWTDITATLDSQLVVAYSTLVMNKFVLDYDTELGHYKMKFEEPNDTVIDNQLLCVCESVTLVRKKDAVPTSITDGDIVKIIKRDNFREYTDTYFVDEELSPNQNDVYYYKFFPMSNVGLYSDSSANAKSCVAKLYHLYGFKISNVSSPSTCVSYPSTVDNAKYKSAKMDYANDKFDYGDWEEVWFIKNCKPCILNLNGTVNCYLDKNDYSLKDDGTKATIDSTCNGNVMIEIPTVWIKVVSSGVNNATIYFSDKQVDSTYKAYAHTNSNGVVKNAIYISPYLGYNKSNVLRSFSGVAETTTITATNAITYAKANYSSNNIWTMFQYADWCLIDLLLILIGKSTDTQTIFGQGNTNSYVSDSNRGTINSGTMNSKGLFYGTNSATDKVGVKVFGIENYWGNLWTWLLGWINDKGTQKVKLTYGKQDGSTVVGYNDTGSGYRAVSNATPSGTSGGYISQMIFDSYGCIVPKTASGSSSTYYADGLWFNNTQVNFACVGGSSVNGLLCGAFYSALLVAPSLSYWNRGARLSCKPL